MAFCKDFQSQKPSFVNAHGEMALFRLLLKQCSCCISCFAVPCEFDFLLVCLIRNFVVDNAVIVY